MKIGDEVHLKFVISEKHYDQFVELSQDRNALHVDPAYARSLGFPDKVVHGNLLGSFLSYFVGEALTEKKSMIVSQTTHFRGPAFVGDILDFNAILAEIHESVSIRVFRYRFARGQTQIANGTIQVLFFP